MRLASSIFLLATLLVGGRVYAQRRPVHHFMNHGVVAHKLNSATVASNAPRPLLQAIIAMREEYGWDVSYEDPPYRSSYDLVDDTNPQWRLAHPNARGVTIPDGGAFQCTYPENPAIFSLSGERQALDRVVACFNQTDGPGRFMVRQQSDGRFVVLGTAVLDNTGYLRPVHAILDVPISIPEATRRADETVELILQQLSAASKIKIGLAQGPVNLLAQAKVRVGGSGAPARILLAETLDATGRNLDWDLIYDADVPTYLLNVNLVTRAVYGPFGRRRLIPIGPTPVPGGP